MSKPYVIELLTRNNKIRYGLIALLSSALIGVIAYDRLNLSERITAEKTVDCPDLQQGCRIEVRNLPYAIKTDTPIATNMPFTLYVEGGGIEVNASWKMKDAKVAPNYYRLAFDGAERWQSPMILPSSPKMQRDWILHLEINARAVDITTLTH